MLIRSCKVALVAGLALLYAIFAFTNIAAPDPNLEAVGHVMSMDGVSEKTDTSWRAITDDVLHNVAFWIIILWQAATALLLILAVVGLWGERDSGPAFQQAKGLAVLGLTSGMLLFLVPFLVIGGEWFAMWQSEHRGVQQASFRLFMMTGLVLMVVLHRDDSAADR